MPRDAIAPDEVEPARRGGGLAFAREGHELLTKKRDILVAELLDLAAEAAHTQRRLDEKLGEAFAALDRAVLDSGRRAVRRASWAVDARVETRVSERRVMRGRPPGRALHRPRRTAVLPARRPDSGSTGRSGSSPRR